MTIKLHTQPDSKLNDDLVSAAQTLYESADHLINLSRRKGADLASSQWLIKQAYHKIKDLARSFEIDV